MINKADRDGADTVRRELRGMLGLAQRPEGAWIPEIIKTGVTGYVVEDVEGMIDAMHNIDAISRAACRAHVLEHFNVARMTDGYEAIYNKLAANEGAT